MTTEVRVPTTGNAGQDAVISEWRVAAGARVTNGDVLVVLETAKASIDIHAPVDGEVLSIRFDVGDEVPEFEILAILGDSSDVIVSKTELQPQPETPAESAVEVPRSISQSATATAAQETRPLASPRARIMAERRSIDLVGIAGTGPNGRIIVGDVIAVVAASSPVDFGTDATAVITPSHRGSTVKPVRGVRKVTAERMHSSLQNTAQVTLTRYASADALLAYSRRLRRLTEERGAPKIGVNDLLLFAASRTLGSFPAANSWFDFDGIREFEAVNLGFAVDTGRALLVPVIPDADLLTLGQIAESARTLIERSRAGQLSLAEMDGGTFTLTNLGGLGVHWFTPVLNAPQTCILGVGASHQLHEAGPTLLPLSLTFDHRAIDGAAAAQLLGALVSSIESVDVLTAL